MNKNKYNLKRIRHYGLRIGDVVELKLKNVSEIAEVIDLDLMDNNSTTIRKENGVIVDCTAEECNIIIKVENK